MSKTISSSIGKKVVMSLTGFFLIIFLALHLAINLSLFWGPNPFNTASHFMATNGVIQVMQYVLALGFIFHIVEGIRLEIKNRSSRSVKYVVNKPSENSMFSSRSMIYTGLLTLLFLVLHLKDFFVPLKFYDKGGFATDYDLVVALFKNPMYAFIYVFSFILLGIHLSHGFQSAFQSVGANHHKYTPCIKNLGTIFSFIIAIGFSSIALYFYFV